MRRDLETTGTCAAPIPATALAERFRPNVAPPASAPANRTCPETDTPRFAPVRILSGTGNGVMDAAWWSVFRGSAAPAPRSHVAAADLDARTVTLGPAAASATPRSARGAGRAGSLLPSSHLVQVLLRNLGMACWGTGYPNREAEGVEA